MFANFFKMLIYDLTPWSPLSYIIHTSHVWVLQCNYGEMKQIQDDEMKSIVFQIQSLNVNACCITCPVDPKGSLGIRMPYLTLLVKNLGQYFTFEITVRN